MAQTSSGRLSDLTYRAEQHRRSFVSDHVGRHRLTFTQWTALRGLWENGEAAMTGLARTCVLDQTVLTRTIDSLIERRLVHRLTPAHDRRAVHVRLTSAGEMLVAEIAGELDSAEASWFDALDPPARRALALCLSQMITRLASD